MIGEEVFTVGFLIVSNLSVDSQKREIRMVANIAGAGILG
jgi:hypothetical protein